MIKNYWHFVVFSSVIALLTKVNEEILLALLFFIWLISLVVTRRLRVKTCFIILCSFVFFYVYLPTDTPQTVSFHVPRTNYELTGTISSEVKVSDSYIQFVVNDRTLNESVLVHSFFTEETSNEIVSSLQHGAVCTMNGTIKLPETATNPHQFDYRDYLHKKGIHYQFEIANFQSISCEYQSLLQYLYSLRSYFLTKTVEKLHDETAKWLQALVLGNDHLLDDETIDLFQRWNLSHILAISGLHIGIIVGLMYFLLTRTLSFTDEKAEWILLCFLPMYAIIAGSEPSVWRASLMVMLVIILKKIQFNVNYTDIVSIVFILLVLYDPYIIYHVGFQFSFAVTFSLLFSRNWIERTSSNVLRIAQISFIAQMAILPLQIHYFYLFQPFSILLNLIIVPYFSLFVIPLMFFLFIGYNFPSFIIELIEFLFLPIHHSVLAMIQMIDRWIDYPFIIGEISFLYVFLYYLFFMLMMRFIEENKLFIAFRYGLALSFFIIFLSARFYFSPVGTVTMLDIGQGDAFIIELPYRKGVFMIDAGATFSFTDFEPNERIYKQIIRPYLYGQGIDTINAIFVTHADLDHYGSVQFILNDFLVEEVIVSEFFNEDIIRSWQDDDVLVTIAQFNNIITRNGQRFQILSPFEDYRSENENSLVLYTEIGQKKWLFLGDIDKEREKRIIRTFPALHADIVKIAHHGSKTSTDGQFIEMIQPTYAFISVGRNNRYNHPSPEVIDTLEEQGVFIYRTDEDGAVQFIYTENRRTFSEFLQ